MEFNEAMALARHMVASGAPLEKAARNELFPKSMQEALLEKLKAEANIYLYPARKIIDPRSNPDWLINADRSSWYYWPRLRELLLQNGDLTLAAIQSIDESSNQILGAMQDPSTPSFRTQGLVIGYVQSGKTANYSALISKAVDVGYRLVIVLSGTDNGLRLQTQKRLTRELVGYSTLRKRAVSIPTVGKQWHTFTREEVSGDFHRGHASPAALQGSEPILLVIKKNGRVFERVLAWISEASTEVLDALPVLVVDDESDLASVDTRGTFIEEGLEVPEDYEEPSVINGHIRNLLNRFKKVSYVAYTATPYANILIPHLAMDPNYLDDLYPKDFIIDLPKPHGYFGAEEIFGGTNVEDVGLDIVKEIPEEDIVELGNNVLPNSLETAMHDFVLGAAARGFRGRRDDPCSMLIHGSSRVISQQLLAEKVVEKLNSIRDSWRYDREYEIWSILEKRWKTEFVPRWNISKWGTAPKFKMLEQEIGSFLEAVKVRVLNSGTAEILDYDLEPNLKAVVIGGNKLSRGLTIEGLVTAYFFRESKQYDTLMQMGRWFGFKEGYEDLSRLHMTLDISGWFGDLANVEYEIRESLRIYESSGLKPIDVGIRIRKLPGMLVTSRLKMRHSDTIEIEQSYSGALVQTVKFPFLDSVELSRLLAHNLLATEGFVSSLPQPLFENGSAIWTNIGVNKVIDFLTTYETWSGARNLALPLVVEYISQQIEGSELIDWTIAIAGRDTKDRILGSISFGDRVAVNCISRTRLTGDPLSLGVVTSPRDELIGLPLGVKQQIEASIRSNPNSLGFGPLSRQNRDAKNGLLLIYPISRNSGHQPNRAKNRMPIFTEPDMNGSETILGLALSFPTSPTAHSINSEYVVGTAGWRPA